ncbi:WecB/TagA/CpsF family glycosyltransferase [Rhodococcus sp. NPDC003994]
MELGTIVAVGGVRFRSASPRSALDFVADACSNSRGVAIRLSNAYCVALASRDERYKNLLNNGGINFADGTPVSWLMRRLVPESRVVRGPTLFTSALDEGRAMSTKHFFLGTTDATLTDLVSEVDRRYPGVEIAGCYAPPFSEISDEFVRICVLQVEAVDADVVWIGLGTPKQDFLADRLAQELGKPCIGVGAAFDFVAGTVSESPRWLHGSGFEWLYRLAKEPRRLGRRYLVGNVQFGKAVLTEGTRK